MSRMINKDVHRDGSHHMMHLIIYNINNIHTQAHVYMSCDSPPASIPRLVLSDSPQDSLQSSGMYPHRTEKIGWHISQYSVLGLCRNPQESSGILQESVGDNKDLQSRSKRLGPNPNESPRSVSTNVQPLLNSKERFMSGKMPWTEIQMVLRQSHPKPKPVTKQLPHQGPITPEEQRNIEDGLFL